MGFLLGAFGKLAAGRRVRDLQARMMHVQSKVRRVARQVSSMSKMLETQKKMELNSLSYQNQLWSSMSSGYANAYAGNAITQAQQAQAAAKANNQTATDTTDYSKLNMQALAPYTGMGSSISDPSQLSSSMSDADKIYLGHFNSAKQNFNANLEMYMAQMKNQIEEKYENLNDIMLEPLKMEEDALQTEKDSLETQVQVAQADYEACKKMEQADAKNLAPNYTGQG